MDIGVLNYLDLQRFRQYLLETDRVLDLMVVLIYYAVDNRHNNGESSSEHQQINTENLKSWHLYISVQHKLVLFACLHLFYRHYRLTEPLA
jgi:hypothetical protein